MFSVESVVFAWDNQVRYALRLLDDVTDAQMVLQPGGNMNHPAWILGHMSIYHPAVVSLLQGKPFDDPKDDTLFGFSVVKPQAELAVYGTKESIVQRYAEGHEQVAQALLNATLEQLSQPPSLSRWREVYSTVGFMLPDLLIHHESTHVGQISIWRRAAGLPGVEYPDRSPRAGMATV
jgi:uncharacterized damage-inducible protein DinB